MSVLAKQMNSRKKTELPVTHFPRENLQLDDFKDHAQSSHMSDITDYRIGNDSNFSWPFARREKNIFGQEITPPHYQFFSQKLVHFGMVLHCTGVN